jgi:hypothetical protein
MTSGANHHHRREHRAAGALSSQPPRRRSQNCGALLRATGVVDLASDTPSAWRGIADAPLARALHGGLKCCSKIPLRGMTGSTRRGGLPVQRLWRGHDLLSGKPMTVIASTDEFRPFRSAGAQFAMLHERTFEIATMLRRKMKCATRSVPPFRSADFRPRRTAMRTLVPSQRQ